MKISIITVNRNNAIGLRKTIDSVANQLFEDFEYIIIDGASSDESVDIIQDFSSNYNRRLYWISEPDKGIYNAMNKGIKISKGDYLLFLNSGDYLYDMDTLASISEYLSLNIDVVYGRRCNFNDEGIIGFSDYSDKISGLLLFNSSISHQSAFIKRRLFDIVGMYDEDLIYASDWKFWLEIFISRRASYLSVKQVVSYFDCTGISSVQSNRQEMVNERHAVFKEVLPLLYDDYILMNKNIDELKKVDRKAIKYGKALLYFPRILNKILRELKL